MIVSRARSGKDGFPNVEGMNVIVDTIALFCSAPLALAHGCIDQPGMYGIDSDIETHDCSPFTVSPWSFRLLKSQTPLRFTYLSSYTPTTAKRKFSPPERISA